jgi:DNA adenine methylase
MNQATRRILELYRRLGYEVRFLDAPRRISCNGDRTPAREVLAFRNV